MQCMKCGQNVENEHVFCEVCLSEMKKYPVRPGTVVQLPKYQEAPPRRPMPKRKAPPTPEEQLKKLRKWFRILAAALAVCLLLLVGAGYLLVKDLLPEEEELLPGQNYSAVTQPGDDNQIR